MNILKSKESVGRVALAVSSVAVLSLSIILYDSNTELNYNKKQLGEAQKRIVQIQKEYTLLEQKFLSVESEKQQLSKRQEELISQLNKLKQDNQHLTNQVESLKKIEVVAEHTSLTVPTEYRNWKKISVEATGYSLIADELGGGNLTAIGTRPRVGVIAVDPRVIPLGSIVYIPAFGREFRAEDTGGMIKGRIIDIYFAHGDQAREWGRQDIEIYVK